MEYKRANIITKLNTRAYAKASAFEAGRECLCSARAVLSHRERRRIMLSPNLLFIFLRRFRTFLLFLQSAGNQFCSTLVRERERESAVRREGDKKARERWRPMANENICLASERTRERKQDKRMSIIQRHAHARRPHQNFIFRS